MLLFFHASFSLEDTLIGDNYIEKTMQRLLLLTWWHLNVVHGDLVVSTVAVVKEPVVAAP